MGYWVEKAGWSLCTFCLLSLFTACTEISPWESNLQSIDCSFEQTGTYPLRLSCSDTAVLSEDKVRLRLAVLSEFIEAETSSGTAENSQLKIAAAKTYRKHLSQMLNDLIRQRLGNLGDSTISLLETTTDFLRELKPWIQKLEDQKSSSNVVEKETLRLQWRLAVQTAQFQTLLSNPHVYFQLTSSRFYFGDEDFKMLKELDHLLDLLSMLETQATNEVQCKLEDFPAESADLLRQTLDGLLSMDPLTAESSITSDEYENLLLFPELLSDQIEMQRDSTYP